MAERKVFAGGKLRRLRNKLGLTQADMADALEISPSYLNLIERNQRPLTVQVLLRLSQNYQVDAAEFMADDREGGAALKQVFTDPLLSAEIPGPSELIEVAEAAPNMTRAVVKLHEAYRDALERLSDMSSELAQSGGAGAKSGRLPYDMVISWLEEKGPSFAPLEEFASALNKRLSLREDGFGALKAALEAEYRVQVRVLPMSVLPDEKARFDRHSMRLFVSERADLVDRLAVLAYQYAVMAGGDAIEEVLKSGRFEDGESRRLVRIFLAHRLAEAILLPEEGFARALKEGPFAPVLLARRFSVRPWQVLARLSALGLARRGGVPKASFLLVDRAGTVLRQQVADGFPLARFGALCARLPVFERFSGARAEVFQLSYSDGKTLVALGVDAGLLAPDGQSIGQNALLVMEPEDAKTLISLDSPLAARPVGVSCRLCERTACAWRSHPPSFRPAGFQDYVVNWSPYDLGQG